MRYYCSYFDHKFIPRGLALLSSLRRQGGAFQLYVLCLDDLCYDALVRQQLPNVVPIPLPALEAFDRDLRAARARRSLVEYYFTLTPAFPLYLLAAYPEIDIITYLDSDLYFLGDPETVFNELGGGAVAIIGHRFSEAGQFRERYGVYNVGWVSWRRDTSGVSCLEWYRERCLEWCFDAADGERFADQKYLDEWPNRFPRVNAISHKGCNLAPWNVENYTYTLRDGRLFVDEDPIVFFHFHGFKNLTEPTWENTGIESYLTGPRQFEPEILLETLYRPYSEAMKQAMAEADTFGIAATPRVELRHTGAPPSALSGEAWRWHLDWRTPAEANGAAWRHPVSSEPVMPAARPAPRPTQDGDLISVSDLGALVRSHVVASAGDEDVSVLEEDVFERADWERAVRSSLDTGNGLILHGVRTFTSTPTTCVTRRALGRSDGAPVWVVQRAALMALLESRGHSVEREYVWPESAVIAGMPERADRRTIILRAATSKISP